MISLKQHYIFYQRDVNSFSLLSGEWVHQVQSDLVKFVFTNVAAIAL